MGELLFWTVAVFTVLAGPPLVILLLDLQRESKKPRHLEQQHRFEQARSEALPQKDGDAGSSATTGVWPGAFLLAWIV
jgi:hypothetical protein